MHIFSTRLRSLRIQNKLTQKELSQALDVQRDALANWEVGRSTPDYDMLIKIADYFNVTSDFLIGRYDSIATLESDNKKYLPILGRITADNPILADEHFHGKLEVPADIDADFVLEVKGNSMIGAGILEGDWVLCKECQTPGSGEIVVALHDHGTECSETILGFYFDDGVSPVLKAANPDYQDIRIDDDYRLVARVVALIRKYVPRYQAFKEYVAIPGKDEWNEIVELANEAGINTSQVKEILAAQIEIARRLKG